MEEQKVKSDKLKKKSTLIATAIFVIILIGSTIAYFTTTDTFENIFDSGYYASESTEVFESPTNWKPGDTTPKTLTVTNTGDICEHVRVSYTENWETNNGGTLPNAQNGNQAAILNFSNTSDWIKEGNYYYYNKDLLKNQTTNSFLESVTFNPAITSDLSCTQTGNTRSCSSSGDGYDNATYTLRLKIETVACDSSEDAWGVDVTDLASIKFVNRQNANTITTGDEVAIGTEHFYVVSSNSTDTVLLSKYNLYVGDIYDFINDNNSEYYQYIRTISSSDNGYGLQNSSAIGYHDSPTEQDGTEYRYRYIGVVPFSGTNYWTASCSSYLCSAYDSTLSSIAPQIDYNSLPGTAQNNGYSIAYYVQNYINTLFNLGAPNSITGRLLTFEEAIALGCDPSTYVCVNGQRWLGTSSYWLGAAASDSLIGGITSLGIASTKNYNDGDSFGVRPVIVIPTSDMPN